MDNLKNIRAHFFKLLVLLCASAFLASCEKEELPVNPANSQALTADMGNDYANMLYFNMLSGEFVKQLPHKGYDLQFENKAESKQIFLNSSNYMFVKNAGVVPFASVTDTNTAVLWRYDYPTGAKNRTAIGNWFTAEGSSKMEVFVVNRGVDEMGENLGFCKMMVLAANENSYTVRVANLDNTDDKTVVVPKNVDLYRTQVSLKMASVEDIEPNKNDWHMQFSQYTDYDITDLGDTIPYLVRGVLINPENTAVARVFGEEFATIDLNFALQQNYSTANNAIGFNWKAFNFTTGGYEINPQNAFVLREASGVYYKLRFTGFYDDQGNKGAAQFEIIGL